MHRKLKVWSDKKLKYREVISIPLSFLAALKEKNSDLSQVKINEMFRLMRDIWTEISSYNNMPGWIVFLVELPLDIGRHILEEARKNVSNKEINAKLMQSHVSLKNFQACVRA